MITTVEDPQNVGMDASRLGRIDAAMQAYVDRGIYAGINTLVARRGQIVHAGHYGWRDREAKAPMTADTIFRLYSMTKPIVCTALMTLSEEGKFTLVDPVAKFIPAFSSVKVRADDGSLVDPVRPMTIGDVMAHTSGLTYHFLGDSPVSQMYEKAAILQADVSLADAIDDLARFPLAFHPGSRWKYSLGNDVVARLIEIIAGKPLGEVLRDRLFEPLGMFNTGYGVAEAQSGNLAAMYGRPDVIRPGVTAPDCFEAWKHGTNDRFDVSVSYPADKADRFQRGGHGLFGTIGDYFRFAQLLCNGGTLDGHRIIGRKTLELMHTNRIPAALLPLEIGGLPLMGYGFGLGSRVALDIAATNAPGSVGEFGWSGAAKTHYWVDPKEDIVALFMTQSMMSFDLPELELRALVYQALE
ncbi:serine hydrolase domain-containing protein [Lichenifustis flavocetrariae]|uniref:Beta-lactamase family protein n=1 Tax=Lichenifustis flavocetrariae TaxID=2949735 RepID=A0AA41Z8F4_9HYPH|nr:serine hydrolase domain-containing protein [Lichenifustis flavocetrariae]MCW6511262.1 beta-lactamase family protein [Lichenifustis flavocetrariae]